MLIDRSLDEERLAEPPLRDHAGPSVRQGKPVDLDPVPRAEEIDAIDPRPCRGDRVPGSDNRMADGIARNGNAFLSAPSSRRAGPRRGRCRGASPHATSIDRVAGDSAMLDLDSLVADLERAQTVGDHERRAAAHEPLHRLEDLRLGLDVNGARRLVEDEDRGVFQEGSGERDPLTFAS